jgi:hypothetical protein
MSEAPQQAHIPVIPDPAIAAETSGWRRWAVVGAIGLAALTGCGAEQPDTGHVPGASEPGIGALPTPGNKSTETVTVRPEQQPVKDAGDELARSAAGSIVDTMMLTEHVHTTARSDDKIDNQLATFGPDHENGTADDPARVITYSMTRGYDKSYEKRTGVRVPTLTLLSETRVNNNQGSDGSVAASLSVVLRLKPDSQIVTAEKLDLATVKSSLVTGTEIASVQAKPGPNSAMQTLRFSPAKVSAKPGDPQQPGVITYTSGAETRPATTDDVHALQAATQKVVIISGAALHDPQVAA